MQMTRITLVTYITILLLSCETVSLWRTGTKTQSWLSLTTVSGSKELSKLYQLTQMETGSSFLTHDSKGRTLASEFLLWTALQHKDQSTHNLP